MDPDKRDQASPDSQVRVLQHQLSEMTARVEHYRELLDSLPQIVVESDDSGKLTYANRRACELTGYTREELVGKLDAQQLVLPEDRALVADNIRNVLGGMERHGNEYTALRKDGSTFPIVVFSAQAMKDGAVQGMLSVIIDITERKRAEDKLRAEASFRNAVIDRASEGLCVCHEVPEPPYVMFTVWNERMIEITGYTLEEINRSGWYQTMYPDPQVQARAIERMSAMREGNDLLSEEWEITRSDGRKRSILVSTRCLDGGDGIIHVLALMYDITERKKKELEREALLDKLLKADSEIKTLRGLIPICVKCKKIRDTKDQWVHLESYLRAHTEADLTHGYCDECAAEALKEIDDEIAEQKRKPDRS